MSFTLAEVQAALAYAKAGYNAALEGKDFIWNDRRQTMESPEFYYREIQRLSRLENGLTYPSKKGYRTSVSNFNT